MVWPMPDSLLSCAARTKLDCYPAASPCPLVSWKVFPNAAAALLAIADYPEQTSMSGNGTDPLAPVSPSVC